MKIDFKEIDRNDHHYKHAETVILDEQRAGEIRLDWGGKMFYFVGRSEFGLLQNDLVEIARHIRNLNEDWNLQSEY